jgi:hypothetical protein
MAPDMGGAVAQTGNPGKSQPKMTIEAAKRSGNGVESKTYRSKTLRELSSDTTLADLVITPGVLAPTFVSSTKSYATIVPNGTTSMAVTATTNDVSATVAYASSAGACTPATGPASTMCAIAGPKTWLTATVVYEPGLARYVKFVALSEAGSRGEWASAGELGVLDASGAALARDGWSVHSCSNFELSDPCANAIDGDTSTMWHTVYDRSVGYPHEMAIDLGQERELSGFTYLPRQTGNNGNVGAYEVYVSMDGVNWTLAADGTFADDSTLKTVEWESAVERYFIEVTVAEPTNLTTIDRVWPGTGLPAGGMPVQIFGMGFLPALTVTVGPYEGVMVSVPFTIENDGQIDFVMPPGLAGQQVSVTVATSSAMRTAANAFTDVEPDVIEVDGEVGGVFTTTDGVVVTIPPQGVSGTLLITLTPQPPAPGVPGNILMYAFRLEALLDGAPLATLTNPVTITLPIDEGIFAIADGERPWLYSWTPDGGRPTAESGRPTADGGRWVLVRGQQYDAGTQLMTVALRPMGEYALSTSLVRSYWMPLMPVLR